MRILLSALIALVLVLTACTGPRPPLRYVERHYHHAPRKPYYATDPYSVRRAYYSDYRRAPLEGTQMRRMMERSGVMYGNACYPGWC